MYITPSSAPAPTVSLPLAELLNVQQYYLEDLGKIASSSNQNVAGDLSAIKTKLTGLEKALQTANTSADKTLTHQDKIEDIIQTEHERLLSKKDEIDNVYYGKMRAVELNDNYRKRQTEYLRIIIATIIAILLFIGCNFILPDPLLTIATIIIFGLLALYAGNIVWEMYKRDNMNMDKLDLPMPSEALDPNRALLDASGAAASTAGPVCVGNNCCAAGLRWDSTMNQCILGCPTNKPIVKENQCVESTECKESDGLKLCGNVCMIKEAECPPKVITPFSTLGDEGISVKNGEVMPYTPYEYDGYAPVM